MTKKLKTIALICTTSCLLNLGSTSLIVPAQASNHTPILSEVTDNLADLMEANRLTDFPEDMPHSTDDFIPLHTSHQSTAASKIWVGNMWIKTWMWKQLRK